MQVTQNVLINLISYIGRTQSRQCYTRIQTSRCVDNNIRTRIIYHRIYYANQRVGRGKIFRCSLQQFRLVITCGALLSPTTIAFGVLGFWFSQTLTRSTRETYTKTFSHFLILILLSFCLIVEINFCSVIIHGRH